MQWLREHPVRLPAVDATPTGMAPAPAAAADPAAGEGDYFTLDELRGEMKKLAWTKGDFSIVPYGYLWGNTVYSTERTSPGSYTLFVLSPSGSVPESNECIVDVRNTRLGFDVAGPPIPFFDCAKGGGKVEIDFQKNLRRDMRRRNKATVMLRHAYAEVKDDDFRLLVGQTWDVISPLNPGMLLYSVGWDGGNIGYRRAQFRGERYLAFSDVSLVTAQLSINPQVFVTDAALRRRCHVTGEPSNWPIVEGRVAWTVGQRGPGCLPITVGLRAISAKRSSLYSIGNPRVTAAPGRATSTSACRLPSGSASKANATSARTSAPSSAASAKAINPLYPEHHPRRRRLVRDLVRLDAEAPQPRRLFRRRSQRSRLYPLHRREELQPVLFRQPDLRRDEEASSSAWKSARGRRSTSANCREIRCGPSSWRSTGSNGLIHLYSSVDACCVAVAAHCRPLTRASREPKSACRRPGPTAIRPPGGRASASRRRGPFPGLRAVPRRRG